MRRALPCLALVLTAPAAAETPRPGTLRTFGDWIVGCDNGRACHAVALVPETDDRDHYLLLVLTRGGGGTDRARLSVPLDPKPAGLPVLLVDGRFAARVASTDVTLDRALAAALANGATVALGDGRTPPVASASLKGLAAAMLWMDERQGRIGTVGALRRPGTRPDATVVAPTLPLVTIPPRGSAPPRTLSVAAATAAIGKDAAECDYAVTRVVPKAYRLDAGHTLVLVDHPCGNGAYNLYTSVFVLDAAGRRRRAAFDMPVSMGETDLVTGGWDAKARRLSSYARGRGIGDCGIQQSYAWDGARFRLVEQTEMNECRGSTDYIPTWRARVAER